MVIEYWKPLKLPLRIITRTKTAAVAMTAQIQRGDDRTPLEFQIQIQTTMISWLKALAGPRRGW